MSFLDMKMKPEPFRERTTAIFRELIAERTDELSVAIPKAQDVARKALRTVFDKQTSFDIAFHLTDWNSDAVLDRETGLVWEKMPLQPTQTWFNARMQCTTRTTGGRKGWRLPSVHELASLVDPFNQDGNLLHLPPGHPFTNVQTVDSYWSATTFADDPANAWGVFFPIGNVDGDSKTNIHHAWCVRGGMNAGRY